MSANDLHSRLKALSDRISDIEAKLKERSRWHDGHRLTSGELQARYEYLKSELDGEINDLEAHGHHVSGLEESVRKWVDSLEMDTKWPYQTKQHRVVRPWMIKTNPETADERDRNGRPLHVILNHFC